ncbi:hypothetical protein KGF54_002640 [Candida jiufengensis]|uniref:uncharacterized protein n=1 Tax=Candida jiufengensis TaxID=497108 RepID=UPI0022255CBB|nr:uncharacterized protein KGF54_002640 [Candida jiufengensis]KAI5953269.1 hypothetical protein KGF54_002640 [Candida jiufengensis]
MFNNTIKKQFIKTRTTSIIKRALSQSSIFNQQQQQQHQNQFGFNYFSNQKQNDLEQIYEKQFDYYKFQQSKKDEGDYQFNELKFVDLVHPDVAEFADLF